MIDANGNAAFTSATTVLQLFQGGGAMSFMNGDPVSGGAGTKPGGVNPNVGDMIINRGGAAAHYIWRCSVGGASPTWVNML